MYRSTVVRACTPNRRPPVATQAAQVWVQPAARVSLLEVAVMEDGARRRQQRVDVGGRDAFRERTALIDAKLRGMGNYVDVFQGLPSHWRDKEDRGGQKRFRAQAMADEARFVDGRPTKRPPSREAVTNAMLETSLDAGTRTVADLLLEDDFVHHYRHRRGTDRPEA
eukprot:TRINITY_DN2364_c0_g2_i1.p2 TRINITY_DN2364_c0_g2~~TRINITY_DN2364_c0_g2_i1.p2  ORF type:complete len:167 (+),score=34.86 TRINITY_DN2364_c0_g2_i1:61-561(+)